MGIPSQISYLENWLKENQSTLKNGPYAADLGFSPRQDASGGGGVLTVETMNFYYVPGIGHWQELYIIFDFSAAQRLRSTIELRLTKKAEFGYCIF